MNSDLHDAVNQQTTYKKIQKPNGAMFDGYVECSKSDWLAKNIGVLTLIVAHRGRGDLSKHI